MYPLEKKETLFIKTFAWIVFIVFFLVISFNYISDSFLIFHQQPILFQASFEPNSRVLKTKYLIETKIIGPIVSSDKKEVVRKRREKNEAQNI